MARETVEVLGLKELEDALIALGSEVAGKNGGFVRTALMAAAKPVLDDAKARVPVASGELRSQIKRNRISKPRYYSELVTIGVPKPKWQEGTHAVLLNNTYGKFVEEGTELEMGRVLMKARPFLRPALEQNREKSTQIFSKTLARKIEIAAKKISDKNKALVDAQANRP